MAFVNEIISEADQEKLKAFTFKNPVTNIAITPKKWTINRERDAFLIGLGGQGTYNSEIPMFYALVWKNKVISLATYKKGVGNYRDGAELWWKITGISVPESLKPYKDEIIELIKEAIDAHGSFYKRDHVIRVNFDLIEWPVFFKVN